MTKDPYPYSPNPKPVVSWHTWNARDSRPASPSENVEESRAKDPLIIISTNNAEAATRTTEMAGDAKETLPGTAIFHVDAENTKNDTLPCGCKAGGRNLVVCIDGTANQFGTKNSNVVELYSLLQKDTVQQTWYNSGIGTFAKPSHRFTYYKQRFSSWLDMAVAWNFERIVCGAYRWLSDNYRSGDRIFIFGFSRGAYQARVISAMIDRVGLLHKGNEMQIPFAYELYRLGSTTRETYPLVSPLETETGTGTTGTNTILHRDLNGTSDRNPSTSTANIGTRHDKPLTEGDTPVKNALWDNFKATFCHQDAKVHFVGAWDTVSSIGFARSPELLPGTTDGMGHVCYFRHALALDERRVKFLPEYASGGVSIKSQSMKAETERKGNAPAVKEVWFAGTHSDIGGGNAENTNLIRSVPPLRWMASEAKDAGLRLYEFRNTFLEIEKIEVVESLTMWPWWILEIWPVKRLNYHDSVSTTKMPHIGKGRKVCKGQKIHGTVLQTESSYSPKADVSVLEWDANNFRKNISKGLTTTDIVDHLEMNDYERARILLSILLSQDPDATSNNTGVLKIGDIKDAAINAFVDILSTTNSFKIDFQSLQRVIRDIGDPQGSRVPWRCHGSSNCITDMLANGGDDRKTAETFLRKFIVPIIRTGSSLRCAIFSGDGKRLFSGGIGGEMRIWDAETGEAQGAIETGMEEIHSLAASSGDSQLCVVGGVHHRDFHNIQVWKDGTLKHAFGSKSMAHSHISISVGLIGDSKVLSTFFGTGVWIWNLVEKEVEETLGYVRSTISLDGSRSLLISLGSRLVIWNAEIRNGTREVPGKLLAMAADTDNIAGITEGYRAGGLRIWDAKLNTRQPVAILGEETDRLVSVCFAANSDDTRFIVSGSDHGLIKVWDATTFQFKKDLVGHSTRVISVVFTSDTKRVLSADKDGEMRVWECDSF